MFWVFVSLSCFYWHRSLLSFTTMPPSTRNVSDTIEALKAIIDESLKHPEKKQEFVDEGSIELIIGESLHIDKI